MVGPGGFGSVNNPASGGVVPAYPPPGGVGANILNTVFSTQGTNGPVDFSLFPQWAYWFNNTGSMNGVSLEAANVNIESGQLVLTLPDDSHGGCLCTDSRMGQDDPFEYTGGFIEYDIVWPGGGWWAGWTVVPGTTPYGEFDWGEQLGTGGDGNSPTTNYHGPGSNAYGPNDWSDVPTVGEEIVIGGLWTPGTSGTSYSNGVEQITMTNNDGGSGISIGTTPQGIILNIGTSGGSTPQTFAINSVKVWDLP